MNRSGKFNYSGYVCSIFIGFYLVIWLILKFCQLIYMLFKGGERNEFN